MKPRIAICITPYEFGGQRVVVNEQTRILRDQYDFTLLTERCAAPVPEWLRVVEVAPWHGHLVPVSTGQVQRALRDVDLVHCQASFPFILEASKSKIPLVITSHGNCPAQFRDSFRLRFEYHISVPFYGVAFRRADAVLASSQYISTWLSDRYGIKSQLCPLGVNLNQFRLRELQRKNAFLYVGEVSARKGVPALLGAFEIVRHKLDEVELWIVGFGPLANELENAPPEGVRFWKNLPDADLARLYAEAYTFVTASYWEGFGLPLLEAFASGTPVLARRAYAMPELVESEACGMLFDSDDELADAMFEMSCRSAPDRRYLRAVAERYSWSSSASAVGRVYSRLLNSRL